MDEFVGIGIGNECRARLSNDYKGLTELLRFLLNDDVVTHFMSALYQFDALERSSMRSNHCKLFYLFT
jgi:hypothetical protein